MSLYPHTEDPRERDGWWDDPLFECGICGASDERYCNQAKHRAARRAKKPKCALCDTLTRQGAKYCKFHESITVYRDTYNALAEKAKAYDALQEKPDA